MLIHLAQTDEDILASFPIMVQLRPHLVAEVFVSQVRRQQKEGYRLVLLQDTR